MQVASPLPFRHPSPVVGGKRPFAGACSPMASVDAAAAAGASNDCMVSDVDIDESFYSQTFKRRRCASPESMMEDGTAVTAATMPTSQVPFFATPFGSATTPLAGAYRHNSPSTGPIGGISRASAKRQHVEVDRSEDEQESSDAAEEAAARLQAVVEQQAVEIERLKAEKAASDTAASGLKHENERLVNENKILKKAVGIQQERQNQALAEIEQGRRHRAEQDEQVRKLEQIIVTLRYHLHAQQPCNGNDFMDMNRRPPDVC